LRASRLRSACGRDHLRAGQSAASDHAVKAQLGQRGQEQKQPAELGAEIPWFEVQGPGVGAIAGGRLGARRPLSVAAAREFGEAFLTEDRGDRDRSAVDVFCLQGFADIVNGLVLLAKLDDPLPHRIERLNPWPWWRDEELPERLAAELVDQLMQTAVGVAKASGDHGPWQLLDKIGPQGFVLPVRGVLRREKDLSQIH